MMKYSMEELLPVLEKQIRRYTMGDSTSVSYNKARQLMGSIIYNINGAFEGKDMLMASGGISPQQAFENGLMKRKEKLKSARELYGEIVKNFCSYGNRCYMETVIKGMKAFFNCYSLEFDALNNIITLDYPLVAEISKLQGIDLIYEYLKAIQLEQRFLSRFQPEAVETILYAYDKEYRENIFNICRIVLRNSLGMLIAGGSPFVPITNEAPSCIEKDNAGKSKIQLQQLLEDKLESLIKKEYGNESGMYSYLHGDIEDLVFEFTAAMERGSIEEVFPVYRAAGENLKWYEDDTPMKDEKLRSLLDELRDCRYIEDKLAMIRENVKSLEDLKEIIRESFEENEYGAVLELLSKEEIHRLKEEILLKRLFADELEKWEMYILRM